MAKRFLPISLIIPCFNRLKQTKDLLDSLRQSNFRCEIIVVDDNSKEDLYGVIKKYRELDITYIKNTKNRGPAYSRNKGIDICKYEYVAFTDNDCLVTSDWLLRLYDSINNSQPKIAGVGGKVIAKNEDIISLYYIYHKILDPWYLNGRYYYIVTANSIFKKKYLAEVKGFDSTIRIAGGEDPGLCFKLMNNGYEFLYNPEAVIIHNFEKSIYSFLKTFYRYGFGCSVQSKKYFNSPEFIENKGYGGM